MALDIPCEVEMRMSNAQNRYRRPLVSDPPRSAIGAVDVVGPRRVTGEISDARSVNHEQIIHLAIAEPKLADAMANTIVKS